MVIHSRGQNNRKIHVINSLLDVPLNRRSQIHHASGVTPLKAEVAAMSRYRKAAGRRGDRARCIRFCPRLDAMERRVLLTNYVVTSSSDTPVAPTPDVPVPLTLRQAITMADANPGPDTISFNLAPKNIPGVVNFDLANQAWTVDVDNNVPLPPITDLVSIDGYTQSYISGLSNPNVFQKVALTGSPTGGFFTLTFEGDTTGPLPFDATAAQVQAALERCRTSDPATRRPFSAPSIRSAW